MLDCREFVNGCVARVPGAAVAAAADGWVQAYTLEL